MDASSGEPRMSAGWRWTCSRPLIGKAPSGIWIVHGRVAMMAPCKPSSDQLGDHLAAGPNLEWVGCSLGSEGTP